MSRICLDSTVLVDHLRGRPVTERLRRARRDGDQLYTTAVNVDEIVRGLRDSEIPFARRLFDSLLILSLGETHGWQSGEWRRTFGRRGVTLTQSDCLVGAAALLADAILATGNPGHFPMTEVRVEHWPVGEP